MTDLTLGLVLVGAAAVAAVLLYNRLQERSARRRAGRAFASAHSDVLLDEQRREPTLASSNSQAQPGLQRPAASGARAPSRNLEPANLQPDSRVDYIVQLSLPAAADASLAQAWQPIAQRFAPRAFLFHSTATSGEAALQLVSRAGVLPESELIEFRSAVEGLAASLGGEAKAPGMREALEEARALDSACAEADIQVALHVVGVAPDHEFGAQPFQTERRPDGVTLVLDVPRTAEAARSYEAMARAGRELAQAQGGRLVDDHGREIDERALAAIGRQLETVRALLARRGIEPGSPLALRLFS